MLNQTSVSKESYGTRKTILVDELNNTTFSCVVSNKDVSAGSDGKKIIKAGTPVKGDLKDRNTAFEVDTTSPVGVILHDVDVTAGEANSQVVVFGFIDVSKVDASVQAMITSAVESKLKMIQFVK